MRARDPATGRFMHVDEPKTVTAAATVIPSQALDRMPRSTPANAWQERAWRLWRVLGVLHYPTSFMAEQVARVAWDVEVNGQLLEPDPALKAMQAVTGTLGIGEASRRLALNLEVAGEVYYARKADEWHVWASTVPKRSELLKGADIIVRSFLSDPVNPDEPDSPVRAALDIAEEIRVMQALSRAQSRSRVGQRGILLVPKEGQFPDGDDFQSDLEQHLTAPIADEYNPSAVSPLKVDFPGEHIEKWRHLEIGSPYDEQLQEKIDNAIKRLALSLNMPPEVLLGNLDSNHWNAWLSEESTYRAHVEPLALLVGEVYAKAIEQAVDGAVSIVVTPDPSELLARRSSVADAFRALELNVVNTDYVRKVMGADEDDAPPVEEQDPAINLALDALKGAPSLARDPGLLVLVDEIRRALAGEKPGPGDVRQLPESTQPTAPQMPDQTPSPSGNGRPVAAAVDTDAEALERLGRQLLAIDIQMLGTLRGQARMAVELARERTDAQEIGVTEHVAEQMQRLGRAWRKDIADAHRALRALGIDAKGPEWDQAAEVSVALLVDGMTAFVTDTLDRTDADMPALPVPLLRQVMAAAGGSTTATVAAVSPTFADPQGFAIGVLSLRDLKADGIEIVQWRFRYGPLQRTDPFQPHKDVDGQFMTADGYTRDGWYPGDHKGCECWPDPVFTRTKVPPSEPMPIAASAEQED